jgi:hypothetical protein
VAAPLTHQLMVIGGIEKAGSLAGTVGLRIVW